MSLRWDVKNIKGYADSEYSQGEWETQWHPVTQCIVHRMMHTGIGWELTEQNAAEFYARCKFADKFGGPLLIVDGKHHEITPQMIKDHIGLTANVSPETRKSMVKRYLEVEEHNFDAWITQYTEAFDVEGEGLPTG